MLESWCMKMDTERCHICLEDEQKVNHCPFLKDLIQKHIGILVPILDDLLSCERCSTLLQLWDEFLDGSRLNLAITHPSSLHQYKQEAFQFVCQKNFEQKLKPDPEVAEFLSDSVAEVKDEQHFRNLKTIKEEIKCDHPMIDCSNLFADSNEAKADALPQLSSEGDYTTANSGAGKQKMAGNTIRNISNVPEQNHHFRPDGSVSPPYVPMQDDQVNKEPVPTGDEDSSYHSSESDLLEQVLPSSVSFTDNKSSSACVCLHCNRTFLHQVLLNNHLKLSHSDTQSQICQTDKKSQSCPRCYTNYAKKEALFNHVFETHSEQKNGKFVCVFCEVLVSNRSDLKCHLKTHFGKVFYYKCKFCSKVMSSNQKLKNHILREHEDTDYSPTVGKNKLPESECICHICFKVLSSRHYMRVHIRKLHQGENQTIEEKFTCDVCCKHFATKAGLSRHKKSHKKHSNFDKNNSYKISKNTKTKYEMNTTSDKNQLNLKLKIVKRNGSFACKMNEKSPIKPPIKVISSMITPIVNSCDFTIESVEIPVDEEVMSYMHKKINLISDLETNSNSSNLFGETILQTYSCFFCIKTFQSKLAIEYHINQSHLKEKHHLCRSGENNSFQNILPHGALTCTTIADIKKSAENNENHLKSKNFKFSGITNSDASSVSKLIADKSLIQSENIKINIEEKFIEVIDLE